jgi:hypothetical protein
MYPRLKFRSDNTNSESEQVDIAEDKISMNLIEPSYRAITLKLVAVIRTNMHNTEKFFWQAKDATIKMQIMNVWVI